MKIKGLIFVLGLVLLVGVVNAENNAKVEWDVMNLSDDGDVTYYNQTNHSTPGNPEINVSATMDATLWWAEVELNTSEIDFGEVEKGGIYTQPYKVWARGTVDIEVKPTLKDKQESFFKNLEFSRTEKSNYKQVGLYSMRFNLTDNRTNWLGIGSSKMEPMKKTTQSNGLQYMRLNLKNFEEIIPFDSPMNNTLVFQITPIWSSVEPINRTFNPDSEEGEDEP